MKKTIINTLFLGGLLLLVSSCLPTNSSSSGSGSSSVETVLHAYFQLDGQVGCYGDPSDLELEGAIMHLAYTLSIEDDYTLMVCVTVPSTDVGLIDPSVLAQKTVDFWATSTIPADVGVMAGDLTAARLPVGEGTSVLYMTGSQSPCPNGQLSSYFVGYLDMTSFTALKYLMLYDPCGMLAGAAESPFELERRMNRDFK